MSYRGDLATHDHLDLLVSACVRYGLLVSSTTAAFSPAVADASTVASPAVAGRLLLEENLAALRWRHGRPIGSVTPTKHPRCPVAAQGPASGSIGA